MDNLRIRGKVAQIEEPVEYKDKWIFSVWITPIGGGGVDNDDPDFGPYGPYETEERALQKLREFSKLACEYIEKELTGKVSGKYIDMKSNITRRWDKADEN